MSCDDIKNMSSEFLSCDDTKNISSEFLNLYVQKFLYLFSVTRPSHHHGYHRGRTGTPATVACPMVGRRQSIKITNHTSSSKSCITCTMSIVMEGTEIKQSNLKSHPRHQRGMNVQHKTSQKCNNEQEEHD